MDDRLTIVAPTVAALVADQFPRWAGLPVAPVRPGGWSNRSFRLGDAMVVRLPSAARYVAQVETEQAVLRTLAGRLPVAIPETLGIGAPGWGYPYPWSVRAWIEGAVADAADAAALPVRAGDLGAFLRALWALETASGLAPDAHNFHRGGDPAIYAGEVETALAALAARVDCAGARTRFRDAVGGDAAPWARARGWALWKALLILSSRSSRQPLERAPEAVVADVIAELRVGR